jgi:hypothetical protein
MDGQVGPLRRRQGRSRRRNAPDHRHVGRLGAAGYALVVAAIEALLEANHEAGTIRPGVTADDFILAIAGIWQIDADGDWQSQATRLLDLIMDGLRGGAPDRRGAR